MYNKDINVDLHLKPKNLHDSKEKSRTFRNSFDAGIIRSTDNYANDIKNKASRLLNRSLKQVKNKAYYLEDSFLTTVKKHPMKSIGYGMLLGFLLALFIRR